MVEATFRLRRGDKTLLVEHPLLVYAADLLAVVRPGPSNTAIMGVAMSRGRPPQPWRWGWPAAAWSGPL